MNRREAFNIPLGQPTDEQLLIINEKIDQFKNSKTNSINIGRAYVPSDIYYSKFLWDYKVGQEQCRYATKFLNNSKRELVFALTDVASPNGWTFSCGEFDVVLITSGFFTQLESNIERIFHIFYNGDLSDFVGKDNFKEEFFSHFKENPFQYLNELKYLIRHLSIGHIIGHEFGHLASGHFGFATEAPDDQKISPASKWDGIKKTDILSQTNEIEADAHAALWIDSLLKELINPTHTEMLTWLKSDPCRITFIFSLSSLLWYATLGASKFSVEDLLVAKTHPPTSFRAKVIFDSAVTKNIQEDQKNESRHKNFALEALFLVSRNEALKHIMDLSNKSDETSKKTLKYLEGLSRLELINKFLVEMGLSMLNEDHSEEVKKYLERIFEFWNTNRKIANPHARWKPEARVKWGIKES